MSPIDPKLERLIVFVFLSGLLMSLLGFLQQPAYGTLAAFMALLASFLVYRLRVKS